MSTTPIVIVSARRTPIGALQGALGTVKATDLGATALRAALADSGLKPQDIDEVIMGCVLQAGLGQAPARQAALAAGLQDSTPCTTINKICGSGMKAIMMACDQLRAGGAQIMAAGGLESMSNAPYLLPGARNGYRMGHQQLLDHMFYDGLQSPFDGQMMGHFAELTADKYEFTREEQDAFASESVRRAQQAAQSAEFDAEIAPVLVKSRKGDTRVERDETPFTCNLEKIPKLRPAFRDNGTVTAASSSSISDGAAAVVLMSEATAKTRGLKPLARVLGYTSHANAPEWFTTAPSGAMSKLLKQLGWQPTDVDLYEINEAFAVVPMAAMCDLSLTHERVNINGGACALGHPIGATGARILTTLIHALRKRQLKRGVASLCIGGGEATAMAVEVI